MARLHNLVTLSSLLSAECFKAKVKAAERCCFARKPKVAVKKAAAAVAAMASKSTIGTRTSAGTAGSGKKDFQAYLLEKDKKLLNERIRTMKPVRAQR